MKNSFFRKTTCVALSFLMMASLIVADTTAVLAETEVLYSCSFPGAETYDNPDTTAKENNAGRASMGTTYGWSSWESNSSIGSFHYDEDTGRNYIALQDSYSGKGAFSISDSAVTTGKIYMSFSYRKPGDASGNIFLRLIDGNGTKYHFARIGSELGLCPDMNTSPSYVIGDFEGDIWHELGFVFDLDAGTLTGYADGNMTKDFLTVPDDMNGIAYLGIALNSTAYSGDITDFMVKRTTGENTISAETRLDGHEIIAKFNEPIGSPIIAEDVSVEMCGSLETVSVTDVYYSGTTVIVRYEGDLTAGREYRVNFGTSVKTLFGKDVPPAYFSTPAEPEITTLTGGEDSAVNTDGIVDFENLTADSDVTTSQVSTPADFYTYIAPTNKMGCVVQVDELTKHDGTTPIVSADGNDSTYAYRGWGWAGLSLGKAPDEGFGGIAAYEFDYLFPSEANASLYFGLLDTNNSRKKLAKMPKSSSEWKKFRLEYDYSLNKATVYVSGELYGEYTTLSDGTTPIPDNIKSMVMIFDSDIKYADFFIDNFKQEFITYKASVRSVRYVDVNDRKSGLDLVSSATKTVEIQFSEDMEQSTLGDITLSGDVITGDSYDDDTYTYTLELGNLLTPGAGYTLTIPETVMGLNGATVPETVYYFSADEGIFELFNLRMEQDGEEPDDVSSLSGTNICLSLDMINTLGELGDLVLIYCLYDDDALVDVGYDVVSLKDGMDTLTTKTFTVRENFTPDSAKVFARAGGIDEFDYVLPAVKY